MRKYPGLKIVLGALLMLSTLQAPAQAEWDRIDLLAQGEAAWRDFESSGWRLEDDGLVGETAVFDGAITDPEASLFLVSRESFGGDVLMRMHVTFEVGRYIGVYLNFGQQSQSGIWMATGHALPQEELEHHVESGYIKTVEGGHWVVRSSGELIVEKDQRVSLEFRRQGDNYTLSRNGHLVAIYHKEGGYPAGPLQLRLVNAKARIDKLEVVTD
jgi:hypothetical protein